MRLVMILGVLVVAIPSSAQSLAEIAAKEAARRAAIKEPARVITEKDLPADKSAASKPAPVEADGARHPATSAQTSAQTSTTTQTDDNGHDERWWSARARPLVAKLDAATRKLEIARARAAAISAETKRSGAPARTLTRSLQSAAAEVDRRKAEVVNARRALEDLEEEARKAGALPGWLRK